MRRLELVGWGGGGGQDDADAGGRGRGWFARECEALVRSGFGVTKVVCGWGAVAKCQWQLLLGIWRELLRRLHHPQA